MRRILQAYKDEQVARFSVNTSGSAVVSVQMEDGGSFDIVVRVDRFATPSDKYKTLVSASWTTTDRKGRGRRVEDCSAIPLLTVANATEETLAVLQSVQVIIDEDEAGLGVGKLRLPASGWRPFHEFSEALREGI